MSLQAMVWALEEAPDVPAQCLSVLSGLANHAGRDGRNAYPSVRLLGHYARKGDRAVQKDLRSLEELGLIRKGDQRAAYDIPEQYRPTVWDLAMELRRPALGAAPRADDTASPAADAGRGGPEFTPEPRGELQDAGGVNHSSPKPSYPTKETNTRADLVSHVSKGAAAPRPAPPRCTLCDDSGTAQLVVDGEPATTSCAHTTHDANVAAVRSRRTHLATMRRQLAHRPAKYGAEAPATVPPRS